MSGADTNGIDLGEREAAGVSADPAAQPADREQPRSPAPAADDRMRSVQEFTRRLTGFDSSTILAALVALTVVIGIIHPDFLAFSQLTSIVQNSVYVAVMAIGMAFLIAMREIDLSIGGIFTMCMIVPAVLMRDGMNEWLAGLIGLGVGGAAGLLNAICVEVIMLPTIVATIATASMFGGLALELSQGQQVVGFATNGSFFNVLGGNIGGPSGIPTAVPILIGVVIVFTVVLRFTPFGYRVRSIGSNPEAAAFSGIRVRRVRMQTLVLMGVLAGFAGILGLAFFQTGDPDAGSNFTLEVIAAAIIGGTPLRGGLATIVGAAFGALLLGVVNAGLAYFNVSTNLSEFVTGAVILFAVAVDSLMRARRRAREGRLGL